MANREDVTTLKSVLESEYIKDMDAVDRVLAMMDRYGISTIGEAAEPSPEATPERASESEATTTASRQRRRPRRASLSSIIEPVLALVPVNTFGRDELNAVVAEHFPDWVERSTRDAMNYAVDHLIESGLIVQTVIGQGKRKAVYEKVFQNMHGENAAQELPM